MHRALTHLYIVGTVNSLSIKEVDWTKSLTQWRSFLYPDMIMRAWWLLHLTVTTWFGH